MGLKGFKSVFSNRNILVVSTTQIFETFFSTVYQSFWTLYLMEELGFSIPMVALLHTIQRSENLLFSLPGGILADRIGRKKVTLISAGTRIISPILYLLADSWEIIFLATIFVAMRSLGTPAYDAMVAESLPRSRMGTGYAVLNMCRRAPSLVGPFIGGVLMESMGLGPGTRLCFVGVLIGGIITFLARYFFLTETLVRSPVRGRNFIQDFKEVIPILKGSLRTMMISSILFQVSAGLSTGLLVVYITDPNGVGLTVAQYGFLASLMGIVGFIMAIPGGTMADRYNRRKLISFGRSLSPITTLTWIYVRNYYQIIGLRMIQGIGEGISGTMGGMGGAGGVAGGAAWSSLLADLVPSEKRGRYNGLLSSLSGIASLPAPNIGALMWTTEGIGPTGVMWSQMIIGMVSTAQLWLFLRDPRDKVKEQKKVEEPARDNDNDGEDNKEKNERKEGNHPI